MKARSNNGVRAVGYFDCSGGGCYLDTVILTGWLDPSPEGGGWPYAAKFTQAA